MKLSQKQSYAYKIAHSGKKNFILYGGAIRGGKTFWLLTTIVSFCSKYPGSRWVICRASLPTLKRTTLVSFNQLLDSGLKDHIASFNKDTYTVTFVNKSQIIFMAESYDQDKELNRFRGLEINGAAVDELNEIHEETFYKLLERSGSWNGAKGKAPIIVLASCNPSHNWVKDKIYNKWEHDKLPENWEYIPAKITDNPYIDERYLESLKVNMPPLEYKKFVEGDWTIQNLENLFAYAYEGEKHESEQATYDERKTLYLSIDFNLNPFGCTFFQMWTDNNGQHFHIVDEIEIKNGSIPDMIDAIKSRYANKLQGLFITGDAMGRQRDLGQRDNASYYEQLRRGLGIRKNQIKLKPNPTHENSRSDVNYFLHNFPDFKINPKSCPNTARDFRTVQCDAFGKIIKGNRKDLSQRADFIDTVRYAINTFAKDWIKRHMKKLNLSINT